MKRILIAILLFIVASMGAGFVSVLLLTIANLYLSGHNITWHQTLILPNMDIFDLILMAVTLGSGAFLAGIYWWASGQKGNDLPD